MDLNLFFKDKTTKPKQKTDLLVSFILNGELSIVSLLDFAIASKDVVKATCIEAVEVSTENSPEVISPEFYDFVLKETESAAPRVKWEATRVIVNTVHLFPAKQEVTIKALLKNTGYEGTVVRWSTAYAFASILKTGSPASKAILPELRKIMETEEKNSIKKIYEKALKGK